MLLTQIEPAETERILNFLYAKATNTYCCHINCHIKLPHFKLYLIALLSDFYDLLPESKTFVSNRPVGPSTHKGHVKEECCSEDIERQENDKLKEFIGEFDLCNARMGNFL